MITPWLSQKIEVITFHELTLLYFLEGVIQGASIDCFAILNLGQCDKPISHLGYNSLDKIARIIFRAKSFSDHQSAFVAPILPKLLTYLRWLYFPKIYAHFASYALQISPPITQNLGVHDFDIFISGGIFGEARPSIIINALSPLLNFVAHFFIVLSEGDSFLRVFIKASWIALGGIPF